MSTIMQVALLLGALLYFLPILKLDGKKDRPEILQRSIIILLFLIALKLESMS